jgi:hypothetical protein
MARIRSIKPEFWTDEKLAECSLGARLLFIGTWNFADDEGRMEYSPKRLKMQVFPGDNIEVTPLVEELRGHGLVIVYSTGNRDFLAIPNFRKHQRVDRPRASTIPTPTQPDSPTIPRTLQESSANDLRALAPEWNGREGNKNSSSELQTSSDAETASRVKGPVQPPQQASRLAQLLKTQILRNKPDYRITPTQLRKWAQTADRMIRLDDREPDRIAELIRWAQSDEFWMSNVLSMDKLREKFDALELKAIGSNHQAAQAKPISAVDEMRKSLGIAEGVRQ